jgi:uncharacterized membrane protein
MLIVSSFKVFKSPAAALLATIFLSIVVKALGNFRYLFIFLGV